MLKVFARWVLGPELQAIRKLYLESLDRRDYAARNMNEGFQQTYHQGVAEGLRHALYLINPNWRT